MRIISAILVAAVILGLSGCSFNAPDPTPNYHQYIPH